MTAAIIIRGHGPERPGEAPRGQVLSRSSRQGQPQLNSESTGRRFIRRDLVAGIVARVRGGSGIGARNHGRSAPLNSSRRQGPGSLSLGNARFKFLQEPMSRIRQAFHLPLSFQDASASYSQSESGAHGNARKAFGEIRNVER